MLCYINLFLLNQNAITDIFSKLVSTRTFPELKLGQRFCQNAFNTMAYYPDEWNRATIKVE